MQVQQLKVHEIRACCQDGSCQHFKILWQLLHQKKPQKPKKKPQNLLL